MNTKRIAAVVLALSMTSLNSVAQPAGTAAPSASAGAPDKVEIPPWPDSDALPSFDAEPFGDEKTPAPKPGEWSEAKEVKLTRSTIRFAGCHSYRLREWIQVHCDVKTAGLRLLTGSTDGIALWAVDSLIPLKQYQENFDFKHFDTLGRFGAIIFPMRKGDRRIFEWLTLEIWEGYEGPPGVGSRSGMLLEAEWVEGAKPRIALLAR